MQDRRSSRTGLGSTALKHCGEISSCLLQCAVCQMCCRFLMVNNFFFSINKSTNSGSWWHYRVWGRSPKFAVVNVKIKSFYLHAKFHNCSISGSVGCQNKIKGACSAAVLMLCSSPPGKFVLTSWQVVITTSGAFKSLWSELDGDLTFLHKIQWTLHLQNDEWRMCIIVFFLFSVFI